MDRKRSESFGIVLRRCRVSAGLSQEQLAERAGLSVRGISDLERDQRRAPRLSTIQTLANALGLDESDRHKLLAAARPDVVRPLSAPVSSPDPSAHPPPLHLPSMARLPTPATRLVGRDADLEKLVDFLRNSYPRLVTLTGPGGVGKTRLAIAAATLVESEYRDGAAFVDLTPAGKPRMVAAHIARTLSMSNTLSSTAVEPLRQLLDKCHLLLVLDNCEHVLPAMPIIASLLTASPDIKVLATSRERLHLRGEREVAVEPLSLPAATGRSGAATNMFNSAAIRLFIERAEDAKPDFDPTTDDMLSITAICRHLDGLPLAIELVAARVRHLSVTALLGRLERHLPLEEDGPRDLPDRQRTLSATIAWSHNLLSPMEQALFRRLSVFVGGFDTEAAEAVAAVAPASPHLDGISSRIPVPAVFPILTALVDRNLLLETTNGSGEPRFSMLETILEHAAERLSASGEREAIMRAHTMHFLQMSEQAASELGGSNQQAWLDRLDGEGDNLRAALAWAADGHDVKTGLSLARRLARFWHIRGYVSEGLGWLERLLAVSEGLSADVRAWPTCYAGLLAWAQGDLDAAEVWFTTSMDLFREAHDRKGTATALGMLGAVAEHRGDIDAAIFFNEESLRLNRDLGNVPGVATLLDALGNIAVDQGNHGRAATYFDEALALYQEIDDTSGIARVLSNIGASALVRGDVVGSERASRESLLLHQQVGYREGIAYVLENLARVALARHKLVRAAHLFGAAEVLREEIGTPLPPSALANYFRDVEAIRQQMGEEALTEAWAAGRAMSPEHVHAEALDGSE